MRLRKLIYASYAVTLAMLAVQPVFAQQKMITPASMVVNERDGAPASITFSAETSFKAADAPMVFNTYLKLDPATDEMRFKSSDNASGDINVARYTQFYKGIKVEHGSYIIASKNGNMSYMSGNFYRAGKNVNTAPQLTEGKALQLALDYTGAKKYIWEIPGSDIQLQRDLNDPNATYAPKGELVLIEDYYGGEEPDGKLHLAYHFDVYAIQPLSRNDVYVDAVSGRILFTNSIIKHVQATGNSLYSGPLTFDAKLSNGVYSLHDSTRGGGINTYTLGDSTSATYKQEVTSTTSNFTTGVAIDAHWGAQKVYDYWLTKRGRLSYNGTNGPLNSYVDYGINYNNAFWGGNAMNYGNGSGRNVNGGLDPLVSLDVCGHEIGHGVCQTTAGLIYNRESGGMNEGFSDIWGSVIENYANPHETDAKAKSVWEIGEEIGNTPLRDMAHPQVYGDPDTYGGAHWKFATSNCNPNSSTNDNCGVHSNSGVLNYWFYLMSEGGTGKNDVGNYYSVNRIGIDTAAQIAYGTELSLTQTANYAACRLASINYATAQYGACSKVVEGVIRAWYAVNVGDDYTSCNSQISFAAPVNMVTEDASAVDCPASHTVFVPVKLNGPAPTGGNATANITVTGGTAINGVDYTIPNPVVTFPAGSASAQQLAITVNDNGNTLDTGKYIDLALSFSANGSNAVAANVLATTRVKIVNDDLVPVTGITESKTVGTYDVAGNITSPFISSSNQAHMQYIITAAEMLAAGMKPNATLTKLAFTVTTKVSTQPFTAFTIQLAPTTASIFSTAYLSGGFTQVFSSDVTTVTGLNTITFANGYVWDGSNLAVDICFTNAGRATANDQVQATSASGNRVAYNYNNSTTGGCTLPFVAASVSNARPIFRFTQDVAPSPIETTAGSSRKWNVRAGDRTYFYSDADKELIAGIWNGTTDLACVVASVSTEGIGFASGSFGPFSNVSRSVKDFTIAPAVNNDTATYDAFFYMTNTELDGKAASSLLLLHTTAVTDQDITPANTQIVPVLARTTGQTYVGFKGHFTGFGRYFLIDGTPNLAISALGTGDDQIRIVNNPFNNDLKVAYSINKGEAATVKLMDVTGKTVYSANQSLTAGKGQFSIPLGALNLVAGNYVLQVIRSTGVFTAKVLKN